MLLGGVVVDGAVAVIHATPQLAAVIPVIHLHVTAPAVAPVIPVLAVAVRLAADPVS